MSLLQSLFGPPLPSVSAAELNEKLKNGKHPLVVDVRQPEEYKSGHINGAKLIPLQELHKKMSELPKGREIVCICASGSRSSSASKMLAKEGFTVFNVQGGMLAWRRAKLPVQK